MRRINLIGGPGAGKTDTSRWLCSELSKAYKDWNFELIHEWIKLWAYQKRQIKSFNQLYVFAKQLHEEDSFLYSGVNVVVTESPLWIVCYYINKKKDPFMSQVLDIAHEFEKKYPSFSILLDREGIPFNPEGRYQNLEEALEMDAEMEAFLNEHNISYEKIRTLDTNEILQCASRAIN